MQTPVPILLVEDEPLWQLGIEALLAENARFSLVGITDHFEAAVQSFQTLHPQIVLLDWKIKGQPDGLAVGEWLLKAGLPSERVVLISGSNPSSIPQHPFLFVPKNRISNELLPLLESITTI
jgi:DNA-binding NarL/FixJ family response regulator